MSGARLCAVVVGIALGGACLGTLAFSQDKLDAPAGDEDPHGWPRTIEEDGVRFTVFEPQVEKWESARLDARSALSVEVPGQSELVLGTVWLSARTAVDKETMVVLLEDLDLPRAVFPDAPDKTDAWLELLKKHAAELAIGDLGRFAAGIAGAGVSGRSAIAAVNDPPRILFTTGIAVLVLLDGPPAMRPVGDKLSRAINSRTLLLQGGASNHFYIAVSDRWLESTKLEGPWALTSSVPDRANEVRRQLALTNQIELYERDPFVRRVLARNEAPTVLVSTEPAELIQTQGEPELVAIPGTRLERVNNTSSDLFLDPASNEYYTLISGRWFRATAREGPWSFVPSNELPDEFAKIPPDDPAAVVRVSIPGTDEAREALVEAEIPETATVSRSDSTLTVSYDGEPVFESIEGTDLQYALNCVTPILQCGAIHWACERGVWFTSTSALGPWAVADTLPASIDSLPLSCPVQHVKYVKIHHTNRTSVVMGYTPGYLGAVVSNGTVVFGTGVTTRGWAKNVWIGRPVTYGLGVASHWVPRTGWAIGVGVGSSWPTRPWWSPFAPSSAALDPISSPSGIGFPSLVRANLYSGSRGVTVASSASPKRAPRTGRLTAAARPLASKARGLDLYATPDGAVFRRGHDGWETRASNIWGRPRVEATDATARLDADLHARQVGAARARDFHAASSSSPSGGEVRRAR